MNPQMHIWGFAFLYSLYFIENLELNQQHTLSIYASHPFLSKPILNSLNDSSALLFFT